MSEEIISIRKSRTDLRVIIVLLILFFLIGILFKNLQDDKHPFIDLRPRQKRHQSGNKKQKRKVKDWVWFCRNDVKIKDAPCTRWGEEDQNSRFRDCSHLNSTTCSFCGFLSTSVVFIRYGSCACSSVDPLIVRQENCIEVPLDVPVLTRPDQPPSFSIPQAL